MQNQAPKDITIGTGKVGAKSRELRRHRPLIEEISRRHGGVYYDRHVSITPASLKGFLNRAGASHSNPAESRKAIRNTEFSHEELEGFESALSEFEEIVVVRSDEATAGGVGLWHSGFVDAEGADAKGHFTRTVKEILASEFSEDAVAFKKRVGLPMGETPGVFASFGIFQGIGEGEATSLLHMNMITSFRKDDALVSLGCGIGGGNRKRSQTFFLTEGPEEIFASKLELLEYSGALYHSQSFRGEGVEQIQNVDAIRTWFQIIAEGAVHSFSRLKEAVGALQREAGRPKYLELVWDPVDGWSVVQIADANLRNVGKPEVPEEQKVLQIRGLRARRSPRHSNRVAGNIALETEEIIYVNDIGNLSALREANQELDRYLLVVGSTPALFNLKASFADYSNAGAIVFVNEYEQFHSIGSHLGGAFREAGIGVLIGAPMSGRSLDLKPGITHRKAVVYANEGMGEGFVALG